MSRWFVLYLNDDYQTDSTRLINNTIKNNILFLKKMKAFESWIALAGFSEEVGGHVVVELARLDVAHGGVPVRDATPVL